MFSEIGGASRQFDQFASFLGCAQVVSSSTGKSSEDIKVVVLHTWGYRNGSSSGCKMVIANELLANQSTSLLAFKCEVVSHVVIWSYVCVTF